MLLIILFMISPSALTGSRVNRVRADENDPLYINTIKVDEQTTIEQSGCYRKVTKKDTTEWTVPRKPIDLVILQDASGSFSGTISNVQSALRRLTTYVKPEEYNENDPHLVKTDDERTTDRVMVGTFQGLDQIRYYNNDNFTGNPDVYTSANVTGKHYTYKNSVLTSDQSTIHNFINGIAVSGGTPTVPAIDDTIAQYNQVKGSMENGRKTVFLLITDGVANGYRPTAGGPVVMDKSWTRTSSLQRAWNIGSYYPEAAQDITSRATELKTAGERLKAAVGENGSVVIGFWEQVSQFTSPWLQYGDAYLNGFNGAIDIGDNRSVQAIFHDALQSMASPDKQVNGKNVSFYVNEQSDIDRFSSRILESVSAALVKDDIVGEFDITDGYKVDAIRINNKKIVSKVTDATKEIRGTIEQTGNKVKISVPDSVFNLGKNSFDYDLSKEARAPELNEDDEVDPPADYKPSNENIVVPELTGKFKAGEFETKKIGGENKTVDVQKLEYCYPSATKKVKDKDSSNDLGEIEDPLGLSKKLSYSAQLTEKDEEFTYTVDYRFNNVPYEFRKNVMLTDPLDYRLEVVSHSATGVNGEALQTRIVTEKDSEGHERSVVVADVPKGEKDYTYLLLKQAQITITARLKEEYRKDQAAKEYIAILQDSNGFGILNQANIMWNGDDNTPNQDAHAKTETRASTIRRSNPVYVKPPQSTEIEKKVNEKEHEGLRADGEEFEYKVTTPWPGIADKFTLTDTVVPELEIVADSVKATIGGRAYSGLTSATTVKDQTVEINLDKSGLERLARLVNRRGGAGVQNVELVFKAKIRPGSDLSKYRKNGVVNVPNTADVILNDEKKTSKEVTVTPPKPTEPTVEKKINETLEDFQTFDGQPYNYNITTTIPNDVATYKKFVISDTLDNDLELAGNATIAGDAAGLFDIQTNGQTITATVKDGKFKELAKLSYVELQIPAKVRKGVTGKVIENKARINFTNESNQDKEVESKPVRVTPPPVTKKINETLDHLDIATGQAYNYNIKTKLPTDITEYKKFVITDTLEGELSVINEEGSKPVITGTAANFFDVKVEGQKVTATMKDFANATALAGQEVELVIPAKINDGVSKANIPNKATFSFTDKNNNSGEKETIPVTVTPPTEPSVSKKINEKLDEATIAAGVDFNYNVKAKLPNDITSYKSYVITDNLDENLEAVKAEIKGDAAKFFDVAINGNQVTATMKDFANAGDFADKEVELVITAKVKKDSTVPVIENKAKINYVNQHDQGGEKETEPVKVTPPPVSKKVNKQDHADLGSLNEVFHYNVDSKVPDVADKFEITDELVDELTFDGKAKVEVDGKEVSDLDVKTDGQKLTVTFDKDKVEAYAGKPVRISFDAKIKDGVTYDALLTKYPNATNDKPAVPNKASYQVNDNPDSKKETSPVTVTPPPTTTPDLKKEVNGAERYDLAKRDEEFTYTLKTEMPSNSTVFEITDELKPVLEFVGKDASATVKIDGKDVADKATITVKDQVIKVEFQEEAVKANAGKPIEVSFKSKIRDGVSLTDYVTNGKIEVPNKATYEIDNNPKYRKDSNEVPVTPPNPEQPPVEKTVNDKQAETLKTRDEVFTYKVKTTVPLDATAFSVDDEIKEVLEFADAGSATLDGKDLAADRISINGQKITVALTEDQVKANGGKEVTLTFKAKIRENANLSAYVNKDNKTEIPNQASYDASFPHQPNVHKDSNIVPVTPPSPEEPEIKKDVNGKEAETLTNRNDEFTYHVNTKVPLDATAFSVNDKLEDVLEFVDGNGRATAMLNGQLLNADRISINGQTITVTLTEDQVKTNGGKDVNLTFVAKIRDNANLSAYINKDGKTEVPNKASYRVDFPNNPGVEKDSNTVPVTPPNPEQPPIEKKVNNSDAANLVDRNEEFTYTINTQVLRDVTGFAVYDTLEKVLEFSGENGQATATLDGQELDASHIEIKDQKITVKLTEEEAKANGGKSVQLSFKAKIREGVSLADYIEKDGVTRVQNTAKYNFNNDPGTEQSSKPVPVIPPTPEEPGIKKDVNGQPEATLAKRDEIFTYHVNTNVPVDATVFEVNDTLVDVLEFAGKSSASLNGEALDAKQIKVDGQTIRLTLTEEQIKANGGKAVNLTFDAKIKEGANLSGYIKDDKIQVPNKASYSAEFPNKPGVRKDSNEVPVTPPPSEEPEIKKDVNGKPEATLENRNEEFTYNVNTTVPYDATAFEVYDSLVDVLEFSGDKGQATASLNGKDLDASQITIEGQTIKVTLTEDQVKSSAGQAVKLSFKAKIKDGVNLSAYVKEGKVQVPNKATYSVNFPGRPGVRKDSNEVPVTPPPSEEPGIKKDVNGKEAETLTNRSDVFTYNVATTVPLDATAFEIHDSLVDVLEFAGDKGQAQAMLDGQAIDAGQITVDGQTIKLTLTEEQVKANGGKAVSLSFQAKIRDNVSLTAYATKEGKIEVPNKASYRVDLPNKPGFTKDSNEVPVTPPPSEEPEIKKDVNGQPAATLEKRDEVFTYNVNTTVPVDATAFEVHDTLVDVLEFAGESSASLDGQALDAKQISIKDQTITVTLTEDQVKNNAGKAVSLSFKAKIKDGANLSAYAKDSGIQVPNKASYKVDFPGRPGVSKDSNEVPVTPPPSEEPEIKKDVNGQPAATLEKRDEEFTYNVNTTVPVDATAFEVHDTLVDVLEFAGSSSASLNGEALDAKQISIDGQTIKVTLTEDQVKANGGKAVSLTFTAKIKDGANLSAYAQNGKVEVPNKATYTVDFPGRPGVSKDSNVVPVTPPNPEQPPIEKQVNNAAEAVLGDRSEEFAYTIKTSIPQDATAFTVTDKLEDVLEFNGKVSVTVAGKASDATVTTEGQDLTVAFSEDTVKTQGGKEVEVSFKAKIKADADLTPYLTDRGFSVPNTASYVLNNDPGTKKDSNKVPVIVPKEPEPEISKKINRILDHLDVDYEEGYMYNVNTKLPKDIANYKEFTVTDTLEPVLAITDTPVAYVDGYNAGDALETKVEGNTVTVSVKDFARIKGFKEIQLYIPSKIKAGSDLSAYTDQLVPNKATVSFKDSNGQTGNKESNPVTVKPRDPEKPEEPTPGEPEKSVGPEDGSKPGIDYYLQTQFELFRFDIKTQVPSDPKDDQGNPVKDQYGRDVKTELTQFGISDQIDKVLKVERIALKVDENQFDTFISNLQAKLDKAEQDLKDLENQTTNSNVKEKVEAAEAKVAELAAQLEAAKAKSATPAPSTDESADDGTTPAPAPADNTAEIAGLEADLKAAQDELAALKASADNAGDLNTPADQKQKQEKLEKEIKQLKEDKEKLQAAVEKLKKVSADRGELTGDDLKAIATVNYDESTNLVNVEITDKYVLEALKGSTVRLVLYTKFKDNTAFPAYRNGVPNRAEVSFNHNPKKTNQVRVIPPVPTTPPTDGKTPPPKEDLPPAPKGDLPPTPTPEPPAPNTPQKPKTILPKTGSYGAILIEVLGVLGLTIFGFLYWKAKKEG